LLARNSKLSKPRGENRGTNLGVDVVVCLHPGSGDNLSSRGMREERHASG
jgi:hypothetical protein